MTLEGSKFHRMVPNLKCKGMVSLIKSQYGICKIFLSNFITLKTCLGLMTKIPKLLGNCVQIPPRVMAKIALQIKYELPKFKKKVWE